MDQTVAAALEAMRDQGYDLVINLAGREYARYGYVPVWRCEEWRVETVELPREAPDFELQPFAPTHREDLAAVYNDTNETLTGTTVRPTYFKNKEPGGFQGWLWTDDKGRPRGYVTGGDGGKDVYVDEHAGPADEVLQALALIARRGAHDTVRFRGLPYNSPVGQKLRQLPSCSIEWVGRPLIYFARIVNLQSLFENLVPEITALRGLPVGAMGRGFADFNGGGRGLFAHQRGGCKRCYHRRNRARDSRRAEYRAVGVGNGYAGGCGGTQWHTAQR